MPSYRVVSPKEAERLRKEARRHQDKKYKRILVSQEAHRKLKEMSKLPEYQDCGGSIIGVVDALVLGEKREVKLGVPKGKKWAWRVASQKAPKN